MGGHSSLRLLAVLRMLERELVLLVEIVVRSVIGVGRVAAWDGGGRERRWNALLARTRRDRGHIAVLRGRGVLPGVGRLRAGVSTGQRFDKGVREAERVGDVVACGVHGEGRLRTMSARD